MMADLNVKVGNDNTNYVRAMGREGCGSMSDNGERLLEIFKAYVSPTLGNPQTHMVFPKWKRQEPDRSPDQRDMEKIITGCQSQRRSRYRL